MVKSHCMLSFFGTEQFAPKMPLHVERKWNNFWLNYSFKEVLSCIFKVKCVARRDLLETWIVHPMPFKKHCARQTAAGKTVLLWLLWSSLWTKIGVRGDLSLLISALLSNYDTMLTMQGFIALQHEFSAETKAANCKNPISIVLFFSKSLWISWIHLRSKGAWNIILCLSNLVTHSAIANDTSLGSISMFLVQKKQ